MKRLLLLLLALTLTLPASQAQDSERSSSIVTIEGESYYVHTVARGETLYSLARLYSVTEKDIKSNNPQVIEGLKEGQVLKIPAVFKDEKMSKRKFNRVFDTHTVNQGETLYAISRRYGIPVTTLIEDNEGLDPSSLSVGQKINIRKKSRGDATAEQIDEQMQEYRDAINSVATDATYHLVEKGETLYGLSRKYGVTENDIRDANEQLPGGLKAGAMVKIPVAGGGTPGDGGKAAAGGKDGITEPKDISKDTDGDKGGLLWPGKDRPGVGIKDISGNAVVNVALMLPLKNEDNKGNDNYLDFYRGVLLGLEDLKSEGISVRMSLYNTARSTKEIEDIVGAPEFAGTDIIIGPVYEENLGPAIGYAERNGAVVVSPLAVLESVASSSLFQMAPDVTTKYNKLKELVEGDKTIIYITSEFPDEELDNEFKPLLPASYKTIKYTKGMSPASISNLMDRKGDNVLVVSCTNEVVVDQILATISSMNNNLVARSISYADIRVIGSPRWARFRNNIDKNLYFKLKLTYVTVYHADRGNALIREIDRRYVASFGMLPSLYTYRGYDAAKLFIGSAMERGIDYTMKLNSGKQTLLQTPYHFVATGMPGTDYRTVNDDWALVSYDSNYSISVK